MPSSNDVKIKITVDSSGAVTGVEQVTEAEKNLENQTRATEIGFSKFQTTLIALNQGLQLAGTAFRSLNDALDRARVVEGVSRGFENLQGSVSIAATTLDKLRAATGNTVSDLDLMKQANQAVLLGLPTEGFDELAAAARKLGAATGRTATEALGDLVTGLGRASPLILDNLGITVKAADAQEKFAASLHKSVEALTEDEKAQAFRFAAMEKIRQKSGELAEVEDNLSTKIEQLTANFTNAKDAFYGFVSSLDDSFGIFTKLNEILAETALGFKALKDGSRENAAFQIGILQDELASIEASIGDAGKGNRSKLQDLLFGDVNDLKQQATGLRNSIKLLTDEFNKTAPAIDKDTKATKANVVSKEELEKIEKERLERMKQAEAAYEERIQQQLDDAASLQKLVEQRDDYKDLMKDLELGLIDNAEAADKLNLIYSDAATTQAQLEVKTQELKEAIAKMGDGAQVTSEQFLELVKSVYTLSNANKEAKKSSQVLNEIFGSNFGEFGQIPISLNLSGNRFKEDLNFVADLAQSKSFDEAITKIVGRSIENLQKIGQSSEATAEGIFGAIFPVNFGLDKQIGKLFESNNAGAVARDKVDAFFEDLLDKERVTLVIDGQLKEIKDLAENEFSNFFEELDTSTEEGAAQFGGFNAIGLALGELFNVTDEISTQMGAALANNVGGTLNNLQLLFQQLGISQEELGKALEESWLDGNISAAQFLETTRQIDNIYQVGIPDGIGRTDLAFQNLIDSSGAGRPVLDALIDLAAEAAEKQDENISTLDDLRASLIKSGADATKVNQAFDAIAAAGISSLEGLQEIGVSTAAAISAQLESTGGFFTDVTKNVDEIQRKLDSIKDKEVNLTFNVKTNLDAATSANKELLTSNTGDFNFGTS